MLQEKYFEVLLHSPVFRGISREGIEDILKCFSAQTRTYKKGEIIFEAEEHVAVISVILAGHVDTVQEDYWGNQVLLGRFRPGHVYADSFVLAQAETIPFTAISVRQTTVIDLPYNRMIQVCEKACTAHSQLIANLLSISAKKNIFLLRKIRTITQHTVREKVMYFLSESARRAGSNSFTVPLNRQALADYLAVNRSSLSTELSRLQKEGALTYKGNDFVLHEEK